MSLSPPYLVAGGRRFLCRLLLFASVFPAAPCSAASKYLAPRVQTTEPVVLLPGHTLRQEIGGSDLHTYVFELAGNQYARILVEQQDSDVVVSLFDPEGKRTMVDRPNKARGREAMSCIATRGGTYRLEIRTLERIAPRGHYEISIGELRPSTPRDESRRAAEQSVTEGEILRARKTATSLPQALEKFGQAVALWRALDEPYETAVALYGQCLTQRQLGNNEQAIAACREPADIMRTLNDAYGEATGRTGRAWAYMYLGDRENALADFNAALALRRRADDRQGETLDLYGIGWVYAWRGDYAKALDYFQRSLKKLDDAGDPRGKAIRLAAIGEVYRRMGQPAQALQYLRQSLQSSRVADYDYGGKAETLTNLGWSHYALGELDEAQKSFAEALSIRRATGDRSGEAFTLLGLAHAERGQDNLLNARLDVEAALTIVESLRAHVASQPLRLSFFALAQDYYEFYVDLLMQLQRLDPNHGYAAAALEASERARARSLLDLLNESGVDVRQGVNVELLERERLLRAKLNSAASYQRQLLSESYTAAQAVAAAKDVDAFSVALGEAEAQIRQASPRYAALSQPQPLSSANIRREVASADTLLLEYLLGNERSFLWAVSPKGINAYELPSRRDIEQAAMRVRELLATRNRFAPDDTAAQKRARVAIADEQYNEAAARLSRLLLAPVSAQLGAKRLIIVAPGALQLVAFAALPSPALPSSSSSPENNEPLIVKHEIVTLPSASTLAMLRHESARRPAPTRLVAILADPVFSPSDERLGDVLARNVPVANAAVRNGIAAALTNGMSDDARHRTQTASDESNLYGALPRLFRTRWEAEQIAALVQPDGALRALDFDANRETATGAAVSESRIIHFATHAVINDAHPELSGIALSMFDRNGQSQDGFLRAHDIFNLKLSADLVVLSACRTALGHDSKARD